MTQPFDDKALKLTGDALPLGAQVANPRAWSLGRFSVSQNGLLAYQTGENERYQVVWMDQQSHRMGVVGQPPGPSALVRSALTRREDCGGVRAEPNRRHGCLANWLINVASRAPTRFTFNPAIDNVTVWSPDGSRIVFGPATDASSSTSNSIQRGRRDGTAALMLWLLVKGVNVQRWKEQAGSRARKE
jgi:hypothetical protein